MKEMKIYLSKMDAPRPQHFFIISPETNEIIPIKITNPNEIFQSTVDLLRTRGKPTNLVYYNGLRALVVDPARKVRDYLSLRQNLITFWAQSKVNLSKFPILSVQDDQVLLLLITPNLDLTPILINKQTEMETIRSKLLQDHQLDVLIIKLSDNQRQELKTGEIRQHLPVRTDQILLLLENNSIGRLAKNVICSNRKSVQGWEIQKYRPSDLIHYWEKDQTYCFLQSDVSFLQQGVNPFTGRKIRPDTLKKFIHLAEEKKLFDVYGVTLPKDITTKCPLFISDDPLIGYHYHCEGLAKFVTRSISPGQDTDASCVGLMYRTTLRRPLSRRDMDQFGFIRVKESNIVREELILDAISLEVARPPADRVLAEFPNKKYPVYDSDSEETYQLSLRDSIKEFMAGGGMILPSRAIEDIVVQKIRPSKPITLYRGLTWNEWTGLTFEKWMNQIGRKRIAIGDQLDITDTRVASWSANICISASFAVTGNYGLVFSYQAQPDEIMLDTRMLADRQKFYHDDQAEIMLLPGRKDNGDWGDSITRQATVEMVIWSTGQRTPSGFLLNEKPTNQYNLWVKEIIIP